MKLVWHFKKPGRAAPQPVGFRSPQLRGTDALQNLKQQGSHRKISRCPTKPSTRDPIGGNSDIGGSHQCQFRSDLEELVGQEVRDVFDEFLAAMD